MSTEKPAIADGDTLEKVYPQGTRWDIDIPHIDLVRLLDEAVVKFGDRPAMDFFGKKITYQKMGNLVSRAAKGLQDMGVGKDTKIGLFMPNTPFYPIMFFAALRVGATVVNFSSLYTKDELHKQIEDSNTTIMVTTNLKEFYDKTASLRDEGMLDQIIRCDMADVMPWWVVPGFFYLEKDKIINQENDNTPRDTKEKFQKRKVSSYFFDQLAHKAPKTQPGAPGWDPLKGKRAELPTVNFIDLVLNDGYYQPTTLDADDIAVLQYTGGTSGIPKGAMLTHFNLVANSYQIDEFVSRAPGKDEDKRLLHMGSERTIAALPYFHVFGMTVAMISSFKMGAEVYITPNPKDLDRVMKTVSKAGITVFPMVPRLIQAIAESPKVTLHDFSKLDAVISGGAALSMPVHDAFIKETGRPGIVQQGYGQSEASPVITTNTPAAPNRPDTVGLPVPRTEIKIIDPDNPDKILKTGEIGEICARGPQVMKGYYNRPEESDKCLRDGWLRTGDMGCLNDDYYLQITDRMGRMYNVNGHNVYPNLTEDALELHPSIAECAVISLPDSRSGCAGKAIVRLKPGMEDSVTAAQIKDFLKEKINTSQMPKYIEFVTEELPKTMKGQADWKLLQDQERAKQNKNSNPNTDNNSTPTPN